MPQFSQILGIWERVFHIAPWRYVREPATVEYVPGQILADVSAIPKNNGIFQGVAKDLGGGCHLVPVAWHQHQTQELASAIDHSVDLAVATALCLSKPLFFRV